MLHQENVEKIKEISAKYEDFTRLNAKDLDTVYNILLIDEVLEDFVITSISSLDATYIAYSLSELMEVVGEFTTNDNVLSEFITTLGVALDKADGDFDYIFAIGGDSIYSADFLAYTKGTIMEKEVKEFILKNTGYDNYKELINEGIYNYGVQYLIDLYE